VAEVSGPARGLVNAVLRKVAEAGEPRWPDRATRLSYPDWIVSRMVADLGEEPALGALETMNRPPVVTVRPDGYVQDRSSQDVARFVGVAAGDRVGDLCAAPGGKATLLAEMGASVVVSIDLQPHRAALVAANAARLGTAAVAPVVADARRPPVPDASLDAVLVDAPCTGLGVLRRRPDARWRITERDVDELAALQRELLAAAADLVRPGGTLAYSVCTLTRTETAAIENWLFSTRPDLHPLPPPEAPWEPAGRGARLLPQAADSDGMFLLRARRAHR
jgi:16S rRNA (cytosine967-C5)-methyltransferase